MNPTVYVGLHRKGDPASLLARQTRDVNEAILRAEVKLATTRLILAGRAA